MKHSLSLILGFVCDEIDFSIEDRSIDACREAIFKPTGRGKIHIPNFFYKFIEQISSVRSLVYI